MSTDQDKQPSKELWDLLKADSDKCKEQIVKSLLAECYDQIELSPPTSASPKSPKPDKPKRARKRLPEFSSMEELYARSPRKRETSRGPHGAPSAPSAQGINPAPTLSADLIAHAAVQATGSAIKTGFFKPDGFYTAVNDKTPLTAPKMISALEMSYMQNDVFAALYEKYDLEYIESWNGYRVTPKAPAEPLKEPSEP